MSVVNYFKGNVLDIGAGIGEFLEYYPNATGIDINEDCVRFCAARVLNVLMPMFISCRSTTILLMGFLLNNVLEHLDEPDRAFSEIKRVLKITEDF